jgi:hypothetical protein
VEIGDDKRLDRVGEILVEMVEDGIREGIQKLGFG